MFARRLLRLFFNKETNEMTKQAVQEFVDTRLKKYPVVVFSKSYCPYCHKAKAALDSFKPRFGSDAYEWVEIDGRKDMDEIQDYMGEITGGRSVPRVFIGGKFFGGGDDTAAALKSGALEKKLEEAGAFAK